MKITICGSMAFAKEMQDAKKSLEANGHIVKAPVPMGEYLGGGSEGAELKIKNDLIKKHWEKIQWADAILILNYEKKGVENYIGGNSFLEMGFAYVLDKKIYLLNSSPTDSLYEEEIIAMKPIIIDMDYSKIA